MSRTTLVIVSALLVLESLAMGADSTSVATPKSRRAAVIYSLVSTSVPLVVGGVMMNGEHSAPLGTGIASLGLILGPGVGMSMPEIRDDSGLEQAPVVWY